MKNEVNENVLLLTANFSCTILISEEEITIKKPSKEQQYIEQIIIDAEQQVFKETLAEYKSKSTFSNFICNIPGFEDTFQQRLDSFIEQYGIIRVSEESLSILPLVSPFTSELNIHTPVLYMSPSFSIINARGNCSNASSIGNAIKIGETVGLPTYLFNSEMEMSSLRDVTAVKKANWAPQQSTATFTGVSINDNGFSLNITTTLNSWNRTSIKH
ncbi:hypothetical protein C7Y47_09420 [Lysinibacillus sphaericus]|uniref:Uncharacterized protein n=1 Tax=Lysinibacillus sphaericus TaxID=1421 RepID=A0A544UL29_LYSSH|nr:hypothetical protein [Lysinibacillus sp. SDF0037]TQR34188.1 hypothetical protein C7Y47_09420 [Lysinibacillus sp. SDF0037]